MILRYRISRILKVVLALSSFGLVVVLLSDSLSKQNVTVVDFSNPNVTRPRSEMASYQAYHEPEHRKEQKAASDLLSGGKPPNNTKSKDALEDWRKLFTSPIGLDQIVESINFLNSNHEVLNVDRYGAPNNATVVIVVQVHERIEYLKYLISTLERTVGIENALLVFSHDLSSEPINQLIRGIKFCRVIQIFYPFNIQIFANTYPGQDPNDCPERISKDEAKGLGCNNWEYPDKYGHYRVAKLTQIKHHWWWKMNYVFDGIMAKYNLNTYTILLEEDHYVSPDFLHVFNLMIENKNTYCADCRVLCLGTYLKKYTNFANDIDRLGVHPWFSSKYNMGMAINRETWDLIRNCSNFFCTYDDYNWDWTLLQVSLKCMPSKMRVIFAKAPRVMHIGDCGVHAHKCEPHDAAEKAKTLFAQHNNSLFPKSLHVTDTSKRMLKPSKPNGGWGDIRDHRLCEANSYPLIVDPKVPLRAGNLKEPTKVLPAPQMPSLNASVKATGGNSGIL